MARPFLFLTIPLTAGIWAASRIAFSPPVWAAAFFLCMAAAWAGFLLRRSGRSVALLLGTAMFFLGAAGYARALHRYDATPLRRLEQPGYLDFTGRLDASSERGIGIDRLFLSIDSVTVNGRRIPVRGRMRFTVPHSGGTDDLRRLLVGDRVKISARFSSAMEYRNFFPTGYDRYLQTIGLHRTAFTKNALLVEKLESGRGFSVRRGISRIRRRLQDRIESYFPSSSPYGLSPEGGIVESLLLGARERMGEDDARGFRESGLFHLFAISGAHIAILTWLAFTLLKIARIGRTPSFLILIGLLIFFTALVEGRPSVLRASVMTGAFLIGKWLWKDVDLLNTLSISAFFLLLSNPLQLFSAGFQLTFSATLAIVLFFPRLIRFLPRLPLRISEIFAVSLCAQLGVLPIMAATFNRIALSGLLLNFAALPLVAVIMAVGYLFLALSLWAPGPAALAARGLELVIGLLIRTSDLSSSVPWLSYRIPSPPVLILAAYPILLLILLLPLRKVFRAAGGILFAVVLMVLITYPFPSTSRGLKVTFLDVGQGDSILVEFPGRRKMLVDGGGNLFGDFDVGEQVVSRFLWRKGIKRIDTLVLTHAHPDHMGGLAAVARNFRIGEFWEADTPRDDPVYARFSSGLPGRLPRRRLFRGDVREAGPVRIQVCHPDRVPHPPSKAENDRSLVLKLDSKEFSVLLTGDVEKKAEESILAGDMNLESLIMKSPHHGSRTSSTPLFLNAVSPRIVAICVGRLNRYGLPDEEVEERCRERGAAVFRTDIHGAIEIRREGDRLIIRTSTGPVREFLLHSPDGASGSARTPG